MRKRARERERGCEGGRESGAEDGKVRSYLIPAAHPPEMAPIDLRGPDAPLAVATKNNGFQAARTASSVVRAKAGGLSRERTFKFLTQTFRTVFVV